MKSLTVPEHIFFCTKLWLNARIHIDTKNGAIVFRKQFTVTHRDKTHGLVPVTMSLVLGYAPAPRLTFFSLYEHVPRRIGSVFCYTHRGDCVYETMDSGVCLAVHDQCAETIYFTVAFERLLSPKAV